MPVTIVLPGVWKVVHKAFSTDHLAWVDSLVLADSAEEALEKYNRLAKERTQYPYMWNQVNLDAVHPVEVIQ